jgi:GMP synthase (glutamine-hydrolysing)
MGKLLIVNCIAAETPRLGFDRDIAPRLGRLFEQAGGGGHELAWLSAAEPLPSSGSYSHLLLTGSELSASERNPRDEELTTRIRDFVESGRSVFGICYGHQMIGRALAGDACCRRAATPEFGWKRLKLEADPLFSGVDELVAVHSHYDELSDLPPPFRTIASTGDCSVQAFAYGDLPVWGTQFHPEQTHELGAAMLGENLRTEARAAELFVDELDDPALLRFNERLIRNALAAAD